MKEYQWMSEVVQWDKAQYQNFIAYLCSIQEEGYREFQGKLIPNVRNFMGIRVPVMRQIAKEIGKGEPESFLQIAGDELYEERMIQGLVIGGLKVKEYGMEKILAYTRGFIPCIDSWSICDGFCSSLKVTKQRKEELLAFMEPYFYSTKEYEVRFALVMLLNYYIEPEYLPLIFTICDYEHEEAYYIQMGKAWLLSMCFVKYPEQTMEYLKQCKLEKFTYNKTLSKIIESYQVDSATKEWIREMKRK